MKNKILLGVLILLVIAIPVSAQITTEVDCTERHWFWYDDTCHEDEVQASFDEVTDYINDNENHWDNKPIRRYINNNEAAWSVDSHGLSFNTVSDYLYNTFWDKINELIDNKLDEREARILFGWDASDTQIGIETARIRAQRTGEFVEFDGYKCSPEGSCLSIGY